MHGKQLEAETAKESHQKNMIFCMFWGKQNSCDIKRQILKEDPKILNEFVYSEIQFVACILAKKYLSRGTSGTCSLKLTFYLCKLRLFAKTELVKQT